MFKKRFIGVVALLALVLAGCQAEQTTTHKPTQTTTTHKQTKTTTILANKTFKSGDKPYLVVNHNKSTLDVRQWQTERIKYGALDDLNRTTTNTAYLSHDTLGRSNTRERQNWRPTGWHNQPVMIDGHRVIPQNRGHLIAYAISFNFDEDGIFKKGQLGSSDNPKNLATQTEFSNQRTMQIFEDQVRQALIRHKKVIYQVTTVFRGSELMPRGYWVQAISTDKTLNFNAYVWNVEPKMQFDYATGRGRVDQTMKVADYYPGNRYTK
ncbi:DNA/RNA non-specific endonuclease [Latilactobacillus sakei]